MNADALSVDQPMRALCPGFPGQPDVAALAAATFAARVVRGHGREALFEGKTLCLQKEQARFPA
jgi:hypothetical protein